MRATAMRPRGFCAGVERAIEIVDLALDLFLPPLYVRKEIVHNRAVEDGFRARGVIFVDALDEVPEGCVVIFSAHGGSPAVYAEAQRRGLQVIDATCPLVTKVHLEVRRFVKQGYDILLIGHAGHDQVLGTTGEAPERIHLVKNAVFKLVNKLEKLKFLNRDEKGRLIPKSIAFSIKVLGTVEAGFPSPAEEELEDTLSS